MRTSAAAASSSSYLPDRLAELDAKLVEVEKELKKLEATIDEVNTVLNKELEKSQPEKPQMWLDNKMGQLKDLRTRWEARHREKMLLTEMQKNAESSKQDFSLFLY